MALFIVGFASNLLDFDYVVKIRSKKVFMMIA